MQTEGGVGEIYSPFCEPTLRPDGLGDRAGVAEAVRVERSNDEEVNRVREESEHRVPLLAHVVRHRLPGAAD